MRIELPLFLTQKIKFFSFWAMVLTGSILYMTANHFHFVAPRLLPMTWVDQSVEFMPNSYWLYSSIYPLFLAAYFLSRDLINLNKFLYAFLFQVLVTIVIFGVWPTTFPRDLYPLPSDLNFMTRYGFILLRSADSPASCCPSLHVSCSFLAAFIFLGEQRKKFPYFFLWACLVAFSTLTTKQHYWIDVATGFLMAALVYFIFFRMISYRGRSKDRRVEDVQSSLLASP
jgi:membrane-associated phospholipid phosphatase